MTTALHPSADELQDAAGRRLPAERAEVVGRHLETCPPCRQVVHLLRWTLSQVGRVAAGPAAPESLLPSIVRALDAEDAARRRHRRASWLAPAAAVLLFAVGWWFFGSVPEDATRSIVADHRALASGELALGLRSSDFGEVERFLSSQGLEFETRVFDLGMMGRGLTGARIHRIGGRRGAFITYRSGDGSLLLCAMYQGRPSDLPPAPVHRVRGVTEFLVYEVDGLTLVFWAEGEVLCALAGPGPSEAIVQLAFAKARLRSS